MSECTPITFAKDNHVPDMTLSASREPTTTLNSLKNEYESRPVRWPDAGQNVTVTGISPITRIAEYFSIPSSYLGGSIAVQLKLFETETSTVDLLDMEPMSTSQLLPLGQFRAGVHGYNETLDLESPPALTSWLDRVIQYQRFELDLITTAQDGLDFDDLRLRTLHIGERITLEKNFNYGHSIRFLTPPELVKTVSGSYFPSRSQRDSRALRIDLTHATDVDRDTIARMERRLKGAPFIFSAHPGQNGWHFDDYTFMARLFTELDYTSNYSGSNSITSMTLVEA